MTLLTLNKEGSKQAPSGSPGQIDFLAGQVTFKSYLDLNSVKVLEKYLISLLGLEKSLKFTILSTPDPNHCKIRLFCLGKFCSSSV